MCLLGMILGVNIACTLTKALDFILKNETKRNLPSKKFLQLYLWTNVTCKLGLNVHKAI